MGPDEWAALEGTAAAFGDWRVRIHGCPETAATVRAMAVRLALEWRRPLDLIVCDYVQILNPPRDMPARPKIAGGGPLSSPGCW